MTRIVKTVQFNPEEVNLLVSAIGHALADYDLTLRIEGQAVCDDVYGDKYKMLMVNLRRRVSIS